MGGFGIDLSQLLRSLMPGESLGLPDGTLPQNRRRPLFGGQSQLGPFDPNGEYLPGIPEMASGNTSGNTSGSTSGKVIQGQLPNAVPPEELERQQRERAMQGGAALGSPASESLALEGNNGEIPELSGGQMAQGGAGDGMRPFNLDRINQIQAQMDRMDQPPSWKQKLLKAALYSAPIALAGLSGDRRDTDSAAALSNNQMNLQEAIRERKRSQLQQQLQYEQALGERAWETALRKRAQQNAGLPDLPEFR